MVTGYNEEDVTSKEGCIVGTVDDVMDVVVKVDCAAAKGPAAKYAVGKRGCVTGMEGNTENAMGMRDCTS